MTNFDVVIHEKHNRTIYYDDIWKIISCVGYIKFIDTDNHVMCERKADIENLEIVYKKEMR